MIFWFHCSLDSHLLLAITFERCQALETRTAIGLACAILSFCADTKGEMPQATTLSTCCNKMCCIPYVLHVSPSAALKCTLTLMKKSLQVPELPEAVKQQYANLEDEQAFYRYMQDSMIPVGLVSRDL